MQFSKAMALGGEGRAFGLLVAGLGGNSWAPPSLPGKPCKKHLALSLDHCTASKADTDHLSPSWQLGPLICRHPLG